jgi:hypothetical protein
LRVQKGSQPCVVGTADIEGDFVVELAGGDFVELLADEAEVRKVRGADDLGYLSACLRIAECYLAVGFLVLYYIRPNRRKVALWKRIQSELTC